jgi:8-oxo-dGTP pyrophosphatase MutT (NUDIX family)
MNAEAVPNAATDHAVSVLPDLKAADPMADGSRADTKADRAMREEAASVRREIDPAATAHTVTVHTVTDRATTERAASVHLEIGRMATAPMATGSTVIARGAIVHRARDLGPIGRSATGASGAMTAAMTDDAPIRTGDRRADRATSAREAMAASRVPVATCARAAARARVTTLARVPTRARVLRRARALRSVLLLTLARVQRRSRAARPARSHGRSHVPMSSTVRRARCPREPIVRIVPTARSARSRPRDASRSVVSAHGARDGAADRPSRQRAANRRSAMPDIRADIVQVHPYRVRNGLVEHLVLRRADDDELCPGVWQVITGGALPGESAAQAAERELAEETAIEALRWDITGRVATFYFAPFDAVLVSPIIACELASDAEPAMLPEHSEHRWIDGDGARELLTFASQREGVAVVEEILRSRVHRSAP